MSAPLPIQIRPFDLAKKNVSFSGSILLSQFKHLCGYLLDNQGTVNVEITFAQDAAGVRYTKGVLTAELLLTCQRCMEPMRFHVENEFCLGLVENESEAEKLPEPFDPIILDPQVAIHGTDLFEDELILCLPLVAKHADLEHCSEAAKSAVESESETQTAENVSNAKRKNPFAVLKDFNKAKQKH